VADFKEMIVSERAPITTQSSTNGGDQQRVHGNFLRPSIDAGRRGRPIRLTNAPRKQLELMPEKRAGEECCGSAGQGVGSIR